MLKILIQIFKCDGQSCPLTELPFDPEDGVDPILAHIIPNSVHTKVSTTNLRWHSLILLLLHSLILSSVLLCSLISKPRSLIEVIESNSITSSSSISPIDVPQSAQLAQSPKSRLMYVTCV